MSAGLHTETFNLTTGRMLLEFILAYAKLSWTSHTRPDVCFMYNQQAQITEKEYDTYTIKSVNKII